MPDLIHFCTEASQDLDNLHDSMNYMKEEFSSDIIHIEFNLIGNDYGILSGTMWATDGADGRLEFACLDVKYKILEPFNL